MKYVPSIDSCPHCNCFRDNKQVYGNLPICVCQTCGTIFGKESRQIWKVGDRNEDAV